MLTILLVLVVLLLGAHLAVTVVAVRAWQAWIKQPLRAPLHGPRAPLQ